jgi:hypothetical protein
MLRSDCTPTFSSSSHTYSAPDTWDTPPPSPTLVSEFPDVVPAHPLDILPRVAPEPFSLESLMRSWPYDSHRFTSFRPYRSNTVTVQSARTVVRLVAMGFRARSLKVPTGKCIYQPFGESEVTKKRILLSG